MQKRLTRFLATYMLTSLVVAHNADAGLDTFTVIDLHRDWRIEQKYESETKTIFCRAFLEGNGTWFAENVRLDRDDELVMPEGITSADLPRMNDLKEVRARLKKCRNGLLYFSN